MAYFPLRSVNARLWVCKHKHLPLLHPWPKRWPLVRTCGLMTVGVKCVCVHVCVCVRRRNRARKGQYVSISWCVCVCVCVPVCGFRQTLAGSWPCHSVSHTLSDVVWGCGFHCGGGSPPHTLTLFSHVCGNTHCALVCSHILRNADTHTEQTHQRTHTCVRLGP